MKRPLLTLTCAAIGALSLTGCPDITPLDSRPSGNLTPPRTAPGTPAKGGTPQGAASSFVPISEADDAKYTDVAVGADGTVHAIYRGTDQAGGFQRTIYYRTSPDGGSTWTPPVSLSEGGPHRHAGVGRLAFDLQGRLYAVWKSTEHDEDWLSGGGVEGTLMARVLDGGAWSAPIELGSRGKTISWFMASGPGDTMVVVWSELQQFEGGFLTNTQHAGQIMRADLSGAQASAPRELLRSPVVNSTVDGYTGLSGDIEPSGAVHWLAQRSPAGGGGNGVEVVYAIDGAVQSRFPLADYYTNENLGAPMPPQLVFGSQGAPHVIMRDDRGDSPRVIAMPLAPGANSTVLAAAGPDGEINSFSAEQGPGGTMAVITSMKASNGVSDVFDLHATTFTDGRWEARGNLTNNREAEQFVGVNHWAGSNSTSVRFNSQYAASSLGHDGRLQVLFVNMRSGWVTDTDRGTFSEVTSAGGSATRMVYFTRL